MSSGVPTSLSFSAGPCRGDRFLLGGLVAGRGCSNRPLNVAQKSFSEASVGGPPATAAAAAAERSAQHKVRGRGTVRRAVRELHGVPLVARPRPSRRRSGTPCPIGERSTTSTLVECDRYGVPRATRRFSRYVERGPPPRRASPGGRCATARRAVCVPRPTTARRDPSARPSRRRARGGTSTPPRRAADRDAVQPTGQPPVTPGLDGVHPAELVQRQVGGPDLAGDPAVGTLAVAARIDDLLERRVDADLEVRADRRSDLDTRSPSSGSTPRRTGENQPIGSRRPPVGIGNSPCA